MRISTRDIFATVFVAAAALVSLLWLTDTAFTGWSTRVASAVVLGLGVLGCTADRSSMADVYGAQGHERAPTSYLVATSTLGAVALASGILAVVTASTAMLGVLAVATVALWVLATARHLVASGHGRRAHALR